VLQEILFTEGDIVEAEEEAEDVMEEMQENEDE
jgi:hypothetical protein